jgi:RNA polymerase sigma factor (sigma-70 family)
MAIQILVANQTNRGQNARLQLKSKSTKVRVKHLAHSQPQNSDQIELTEVQGEELIVKYRTKARKLGRSILRRWHARLDIQEVDSIVDLSLCEAALRFNPEKGASFMTFLFYHMRGNLIRAVTTAASLNTVPLSSIEQNRQSSGMDNDTPRLFQVSGQANALEVAEALMGQESLIAEDVLIKKEMIELCSKFRDKLDPLEREIIERLYIQEQQLLDVAHLMGYSRCHISRIRSHALKVLQAEMCDSLDMEPVALDNKDNVGFEDRRRKINRRRPRSKIYGRKVEQRHAA